MTIINSPVFMRPRPWVLENSRRFDREAYIFVLLAQYPRLPEDFRVWISEWPTHAVVGGAWPGLPLGSCLPNDGDDNERFSGVNWLALIPPKFLHLSGPNYSFDFIPGLCIQGLGVDVGLILNDDEHERSKGTLQFHDKIITTVLGGGHIIGHSRFMGLDVADSNWIEWQRRIWTRNEKVVRLGPRLWPGVEVTRATLRQPLTPPFHFWSWLVDSTPP
jgi:hypothetical protein